MAGVQVSKNEVHTHIHLDYTRIEFLSCKKKLNKKKNFFKEEITYSLGKLPPPWLQNYGLLLYNFLAFFNPKF